MRYFFTAIALLLPLLAGAQMTAPGARAIRYTNYSASSPKDPVFIYCNDNGSVKGSLSASSPKGSSPFNYSWFRWNQVTKNFSIPVKNDIGVVTSSVTDLAEGGYKVVISGGFDTSYVAWIFLDSPYAMAKFNTNTCEYVAMFGGAAVDTFYYKNPSTGDSLRLPNGVRFLWSSDPTSSIPFPDLEINPQTFNPPLVDVRYKIAVTDSFGCLSQSEFDYKSIHVKADFTVDPTTGEAPLEVSFTDKSIRGSVYKWKFGDGKDSISDQKDPGTHIYYKPGEYTVKLYIESDLLCADSAQSAKIVVEQSEIHIPNVFTPDGDGINDKFIVESKSLRYISVEIFSRSGLKVYGFNGAGKILKEWDGWDGYINNSSSLAAPGIYFYIIRALGWDDIDYNTKKQRGYVYLYR